MSDQHDTPEPRRDWFAVERRVFDDEMFAGEYDRRSAWLWLIANAARKAHHVRTRGGIVELKRGEVMIGREFLATTWGWTPSRVRTFLDQLCSSDRIEYRQSNGHHPNVAKVKNYGRFQDFDAAASPVKSPVDRQSVASGSPHPYKEQDTEGSRGDDETAKSKPAKTKRANGALTAFERAAAEAAIGDYNTAAATMGFSRCAASEARLSAVATRLADLGKGDVSAGRVRWREALQAVGHWPFVAGREKPKPGKTPYKLDLERLLSTGSGLGDVLAKLLDLYAEHGPARAAGPQQARPAINAAWAEAQAEELATQRARWNTSPKFSGGGHGDFH